MLATATSSASNILPFPARATAFVLLTEATAGWLVLARGHGWLFGDRRAAVAEAQKLSENLALPIRSTL
jgi:hypothetical protein